MAPMTMGARRYPLIKEVRGIPRVRRIAISRAWLCTSRWRLITIVMLAMMAIITVTGSTKSSFASTSARNNSTVAWLPRSRTLPSMPRASADSVTWSAWGAMPAPSSSGVSGRS